MITNQHLLKYGTLEHRRMGMLLLMLLVFALTMAMPDTASAFDGSFGPDQETVSNIENSMAAWWKSFATPAMWCSLAALAVSVIFFGGRLWGIPVVTALIFLSGEMIVNGVKSFMG